MADALTFKILPRRSTEFNYRAAAALLAEAKKKGDLPQVSIAAAGRAIHTAVSIVLRLCSEGLATMEKVHSSCRHVGGAGGTSGRVQLIIVIRASRIFDYARDVYQRPCQSIHRLVAGASIFDLYLWDEVLQESGDGGKVVVCRPKSARSFHHVQGTEYIMKISSKEAICECRGSVDEESFRKSYERVLNLPPHDGIIGLHEILEDDRFFYLIMDRATGGSLFDGLVTLYPDGIIPESALRKVLHEILVAVSHLHRQGLLHRDIKPDNFVMRTRGDGDIKTGATCGLCGLRPALIDFDHAVEYDQNASGPLSTVKDTEVYVYGTLRFNAPETLHGEYSTRSDLYSVGVILYLLMTGKMPHGDEAFDISEDDFDPESLYDYLRNSVIDFECDPWQSQLTCSNFVKSLLAFCPGDRPSCADEALSHPWFAELAKTQ